jgi:hemolysin III
MERWRWGKMTNPVRGLLHGAAGLAAAAGAALLTMRASEGQHAIAGLVFGLSLMAMFTVSAIYHAVDWRQSAKTFLQRLDHSMIFLVVAGTFTPFGVVLLDDPLRLILLTLLWGTALVGITLKFVLPRVKTGLSIGLQHAMGWSSLAAVPVIWQKIGAGAVAMILAGGVFYTAGTIMFAMKRPRLFPRVFSYHELFHVMVIVGSAFHFLAILWFVMPYAA